MNNKEFIENFFKGRAVSRPPFIPLVGTYITKVDQVSQKQLYSDPGVLTSAISNTKELLGYDPLITPIDTTVEAEALGATVEWNDRELPSISKRMKIDYPINPEAIQDSGRIGIILEAVERLEKINGREKAIIVTLTGPLTVLQQLYEEEDLQALEFYMIEKKLEVITQALVQLCKNYGDKKVSGILLYEDINFNTLQIKDLKKFYSPIFNVIKYYNMFGIFRVPEDAEIIPNLHKSVIGSQDLILKSKFRTKGIALNDSYWKETHVQENYRDLWYENNKRRLFFSTCRPLDLHIELSILQEKVSSLCDPITWS